MDSKPVVATGKTKVINRDAVDHIDRLFFDNLAQSTGFESLDREGVAGQILRSDPVLRDKLAQGLLRHCQRVAEITGDRRSHTVDYVLTDIEKATLKKMYPQYLLEFTGKIRHEHAFSAASRDVDERMLIDRYKIAAPSKHYMAAIKDIGGNPGRHLTRGRLGVHCCFPLLSPADAVRHTRFLTEMASYDHIRRPCQSRRVYNRYLRGVDLCNKRCEECTVTAPYIISVHSAYDMSKESLAEAMIRADAHVLRGTMIYHSDVLIFEKGVIPDQKMCFSRFKKDNKQYIRFYYPYGGSLDYTHEYSRYIELIKTIGFSHEGSDFSIEIEDIFGGRLVFCMYRHYSVGIPRGIETRTLSLDHDDLLVVYYWRAINPQLDFWSVFSLGNTTRLVRVRIVVEKKLFEKMYTYATTLTEGKFVPQNIINAGHAYNQRQVIGGSVVAERSSHLTAADIVTLAHVIYLRVYVQRYVESKTMNLVKEYIDAARIEKSIYHRFLDFITSPIWAVKTFSDLPNELSFETAVAPVPDPLLSVEKLVMNVDKFPSVISLEQDVEFTGLGSVVKPFFSTEDETDEIVEDRKVPMSQPGECVGDFVEIPVGVDGNCFFHALRAVGATSLDAVSLRKKFLVTLGNWDLPQVLVEEQRRRLSDFSSCPSMSHWADETTFYIAARDLGVRLCVHLDSGIRIYGDGKVFHLRLHGEHMVGLSPKQTLPACLLVAVDTNKTFSVPNLEDYKERLFSTLSLKKVKTAITQTYKYAGLGNCGYVCRSGAKLAEIFYRFPELSTTGVALDICSGPGGFCQFLVSRGYTVAYINCDDFVPMTYRSTAIYSLIEGSGDLLSPSVLSSVLDVEDTFSLVVGDGCPPGNSRGVVSADEFFPLLENQITVALRLISLSGNYVQKFMFPQDERAKYCLERIASNFKRVFLVRPCTVRPTSDEFYVVALSYTDEVRRVGVSSALTIVARDQYEALTTFSSVVRTGQIFANVTGTNVLRSVLSYVPFAGGEISALHRSVLGDFYLETIEKNIAIAEVEISEDLSRIQKQLMLSAEATIQSWAPPSRPVKVDHSKSLIIKEKKIAKTKSPLRVKTDIFGRCLYPYRTYTFDKIPSSEFRYVSLVDKVRDIPVANVDIDDVESVYYSARSDNDSVASDGCATILGVPHMLEEVPETPDYERLVRKISASRVQPASVVSEEVTSVVRPDDVALSQSIVNEYLSMLRHVVNTEDSNFRCYFSRINDLDPRSMSVFLSNIPGADLGYGRVVDGRLEYLCRPRDPLEYVFCHDGENFTRVSRAEGRLVMVSETTEKFFEIEFLEKYDGITVGDVKLSLVQAAAGCGKTTDIVRRARELDSCLVLAGTIEGKEDIDRRLGISSVKVRTIQSFLLNPEECKNLFIDEAMMQHPGMILIAAKLSNAANVYAYGDRCQIPFVNRARQFQVLYKNLADYFDTTAHLMTSYRCPVSVAARLYDRYLERTGVGMTSVHDRRDGERVVNIHGLEDVPNAGYDVYLTFKQSEKHLLISKGYKASTVHSFQGKEAHSVAVVRLSTNAQDEIYLRDEYALVALTRHTHRLTYFTMCANDSLSKMILCVPPPDKCDSCLVVVAGGTYDTVDMEILPVPVLPRNVDADTIVVRDKSIKEWKNTLRHVKPGRDVAFEIRSSIDVVSFMGIARRMLCNAVYLRLPIMGLAPYCVFAVMNKSGLMPCPRPTKLAEPCLEYEKISYTVPSVAGSAICANLQNVINTVFPSCAYVDQSFDTLDVHLEDCFIPLRDVSLVPYRDTYKCEKYDTLRPRLITCMPRRRPSTLRESLLALLKRNANVPDLAGIVDIPRLVNRMVDSVITVLKPDYERSPIMLSVGDIADWLHEQPACVADKLLEPLGLHEMEMTVYDFMIKRDVKPDLTDNAAYVYSALQTVMSHPKTINAITCPMIRRLKERVLAALPDNILMFTDVTPEEFCDRIARVLDPRCRPLNSLEVDISKYDKSQGLVALMYECRIMSHFGVPDWFVAMWFRGHIATEFVDHQSGLRGRIAFQRKSGDAFTYLGNTLFLLGVLLSTFNYSEMDLLLCSGDDSLILGGDFDRNVEAIDFNLLFNLETKFLKYHYYYFCSKYLLSDGQQWWLVPDPVKLMVKLGRHDLVNWDHCEEYRISYADNVKAYTQETVCVLLSHAVRERYLTVDFDLKFFLASLYYASLPENFSQLFYTLPSDVLSTDISRPRLDN
nr:MAG: non-structural polyprotein [Wufeng rodent hepe-like virus 1]